MLAFGLFGIAAFYIVYVTAIDLAGMSVAAVLLYTAPAWVALISAVFLGEKLTPVKLVAVTLAMAGCALVARVYDVRGLQLNWLGILAGLGAGLTYALYSVFNKVGLRRHDGWTVLAYGLLVQAVCFSRRCNPRDCSSLHCASRARSPGCLCWRSAPRWEQD